MNIGDIVIVVKYTIPYEAKIISIYYLDNVEVDYLLENIITGEKEHIRPEDVLSIEG